MNMHSLLAAATMAILFSSCSTSKMALRTLHSKIEQEIKDKKGTFAVAFKDLQSGKSVNINDHVVYHAASTMKTPVMVEVYKQAAEGKLSLSDSLELKNDFISIADGTHYSLDSADDSETDLYKHIGEKRTISYLLYQMIIVSSNFATNLIMQKVGPGNVTESMRQLGAKSIDVLRGVEDNKAFAKGLNNTTTANDLLIIFEKIAKGQAVNADASVAMISILLDQRFNEVIPALLPAGLKVAHKTGSIAHILHDSGIVILPDGRKYVLVLLSKDWDDEKIAISTMANISLLVYQYVTNK